MRVSLSFFMRGLASIVVVTTACSTAVETPIVGPPVSTGAPKPTTTAAAPTTASAMATAPNTPEGPADPAPPADPNVATTWTDEGSIAELAKNCAWMPELPQYSTYHPLGCAPVPDQSCAPDHCFQVNEEECKPACAKPCVTCATKCVEGCETCKKTCSETDDACKLKCATSCATCRQACVTSFDTCQSAKCGAEAETCYQKIADEWEKSPCSKRCEAMSKCVSSCVQKEIDEAEKKGEFPAAATWTCNAKCWRTVMAGCPKKFDGRCGTY